MFLVKTFSLLHLYLKRARAFIIFFPFSAFLFHLPFSQLKFLSLFLFLSF